MNDSDEDLIETVTILYDDDVGNITDYDVSINNKPKEDYQSSIQDTDGSLIETGHKVSAIATTNEAFEDNIEETVAVVVNDFSDKGICLINIHFTIPSFKWHNLFQSWNSFSKLFLKCIFLLVS